MLCQAWVCTGSDVTPEAGSGGSLLWPHHGGEETTVQHGCLLLHLPLQAKLRGAAHQKHIFVSTYKQLTQRFFPLLTIQNIKITFLEVPVLVKPLARGFFLSIYCTVMQKQMNIEHLVYQVIMLRLIILISLFFVFNSLDFSHQIYFKN